MGLLKTITNFFNSEQKVISSKKKNNNELKIVISADEEDDYSLSDEDKKESIDEMLKTYNKLGVLNGDKLLQQIQLNLEFFYEDTLSSFFDDNSGSLKSLMIKDGVQFSHINKIIQKDLDFFSKERSAVLSSDEYINGNDIDKESIYEEFVNKFESKLEKKDRDYGLINFVVEFGKDSKEFDELLKTRCPIDFPEVEFDHLVELSSRFLVGDNLVQTKYFNSSFDYYQTFSSLSESGFILRGEIKNIRNLIDCLKVPQIKEILKSKGEKVGGKKDDIISRLISLGVTESDIKPLFSSRDIFSLDFDRYSSEKWIAFFKFIKFWNDYYDIAFSEIYNLEG